MDFLGEEEVRSASRSTYDSIPGIKTRDVRTGLNEKDCINDSGETANNMGEREVTTGKQQMVGESNGQANAIILCR